jgi:predicted phage terminase large subunit-like protein
MARVIVVTSGKGGVGKTSVTSNLGITLAKENKVCLIDADLGLKNLDVVLGIENRVIFDMQDVISGVCSLAQALVKDKRSNNLFVLPACKSIDVQKINFSYLEKIINDLKDNFDYILIDSPAGIERGFHNAIKNADEAYNENRLQQLIDWFDNTMMSRTENGFKLIIIMTRWTTNDLAGYILANWENVVHVDFKAVQEDGSMLCEEILSAEDYKLKTKNMNRDIVLANYQQEPIDVKGRLYSNILTYTERPEFDYILNYTDTADEGSDYLCSICYGVSGGFLYVLDVLYTKEAMEVTEPATAKMLSKHHVGTALIESNNGGRGFARNVERELRDLKNNHTQIKWFHQSKNKKARILSNSTGVMKNVLFPKGWQDMFPDFANDLLKYQKEGKNAHDDAPDALTGVYENQKPRGVAQLKTFKGGV